MLIKNRKGFDIKIDGIKIGDEVFKDGEAFNVIAIDIDTEPSYMLNGYKDRCYSINDIDPSGDWNVIYDATNEENMNYNLWVSRKEIKTLKELDFNITKDGLKILEDMYNGKNLCSGAKCKECPLYIDEIYCDEIVELYALGAKQTKHKLKSLVKIFKKYLKEEK